MEAFIPEDFKIENIPLNLIKTYKNNPKIHNNKQIQQIKTTAQVKL